MPELAYVNGTFGQIEDATVSIEDRGFQFADGVYEVIVAYGGKPFGLAEHLSRLARSLEAIALPFDFREHRIEEIIAEGVARAGFDEVMVYLQITRGAAPRSLAYDPNLRPTVVATFKPKPTRDPALRRRGLSVITVPDIRWPRCDIKSVALLANSIAKNDALRRGYDDAILVSPRGEVREATAANVFALCDGLLVTPPKSKAILHGVTRDFVLQCPGRIDLPWEERHLTVEDLTAADELFLSSTTVDIIGITRLNDAPVGAGRVGPVTERLYEQFRQSIAELCR